MSMTEAVEERDSLHDAAAIEQPAESPIVPQATISGRALVAVVAIMTFLAALTLGAVIMVRAAASEWQAEVAREVTIQLRPVAGRDIEADVNQATAIARGVAGVVEARAYSRQESARLLEPWLGSGLALDELPVPRLVVVRLAAGGTADLAQLRRLLQEQVAGATVDDHRSFIERMRAAGAAALAAGMAVLALVFTATVLSVTFATSAAMASNRPVIEVLHLIGARDAFIAGHFQRHFLRLGLKGGLIGGGSAIALFAIVDLLGGRVAAAPGGDQLMALFGSYSIGVAGYVAMLVLVGLIAFVTAASSRYTVNRTIATAQ
jgi:cell division transport system permease protein